MKTKVIILATAYPYTTGILTIIWVGSALLLAFDSSLKLNLVIIVNLVATLIIGSVGFKK